MFAYSSNSGAYDNALVIIKEIGDTHVGTIEEQYDRDFGIRGDAHLDTLLEREGVASLNDLIHGDHGRK
jgi:hypothetical protein